MELGRGLDLHCPLSISIVLTHALGVLVWLWCAGVAPRAAVSGGSGLLSGPLGDLLLASATAAAAAQHEGGPPKAEGAHPKAEGAGAEGASEVAGQAVCLVRAAMRREQRLCDGQV